MYQVAWCAEFRHLPTSVDEEVSPFGSVLSCGHTAQKSRKRMNHAQNSSLTRYMRDLRISSVCLTWNLRSGPPMFAGSALYAIPGFEQLKTRLRVRVYAVLRCFT